MDTVMAADEGSRVEAVPPAPAPAEPTPPLASASSAQVTPRELADLAPRLAGYLPSGSVSWPQTVDAAPLLAGELGVSRHLWGEACLSMGRERAAMAIAIVSTKPAAHFSRSAGGYFAGMVRKHERGEWHLDRSLWALRTAKWDRRRVH